MSQKRKYRRDGKAKSKREMDNGLDGNQWVMVGGEDYSIEEQRRVVRGTVGREQEDRRAQSSMEEYIWSSREVGRSEATRDAAAPTVLCSFSLCLCN